MEQQDIKNRNVKYVSLLIYTEIDCDVSEGEYGLSLTASFGGLDLSAPGGLDDITLVRECIEENLEVFNLPDEGCTEVILQESGEWEGVSWHKYYIVERVCVLDS